MRVAVANFFFFLTFASFFLLPLHVRALGGSERTVGFVMGTAGLSGLASVLVVGPLLDRFGRRPFLLGGFAAMATVAAAFLAVDRIGPGIFVLRALQGLAFAAAFNAASTLAVELAPPERRAAALGVFGISTLTTHAIAPALGEQIVQRGGFAALFVVAAVCSVIAVAIAWSVPEGTHHASTSAARVDLPPMLRRAIVTVGCSGVAFGSVITFVPTFVHAAHLGGVSTFFLSYTAAAVLVRLGGGGLGDRFGRRRVARPALVLLAASIGTLAAVHSPWALAVVGLVFGAAQGIAYPTLNAFTVDHAGAGQLGRVQALFNGAFNLGVTLGSVALGNVVDAFGHRPMFVCAAATALAGVVILGTESRG